MLYTRYNKAGTKVKVARAELPIMEKAGFTYEVNPVDSPVVEEAVEKEVVEEAVVEEAPAPAPKKRGRKPKAPEVVEEVEKDIVL